MWPSGSKGCLAAYVKILKHRDHRDHRGKAMQCGKSRRLQRGRGTSLALSFLCGLCGSALIFSANAEGPQPPKSGIEFQSADVRAMQADDFANPATLWVERGAALWQAPRGERGVSCAAC